MPCGVGAVPLMQRCQHADAESHNDLMWFVLTLLAAGRGPEWQFIDLLPAQAGKGKAMLHMQQKLGFADASTVVAGDADNDMLMLQEAPRSILVGNASPELKDWARQQQAQRQEQLGGDGRGQNSMFIAAEPIAAGVMEGLRAFGMPSVPN